MYVGQVSTLVMARAEVGDAASEKAGRLEALLFETEEVEKRQRGDGRQTSTGELNTVLQVGSDGSATQQETHLWLFLEPSFVRSATVSGNGCTRCTGPFAMSATVWPSRFTRVTSAPFETR